MRSSQSPASSPLHSLASQCIGVSAPVCSGHPRTPRTSSFYVYLGVYVAVPQEDFSQLSVHDPEKDLLFNIERLKDAKECRFLSTSKDYILFFLDPSSLCRPLLSSDLSSLPEHLNDLLELHKKSWTLIVDSVLDSAGPGLEPDLVAIAASLTLFRANSEVLRWTTSSEGFTVGYTGQDLVPLRQG